ncbi:HPr family phosphocarrier protein [Myxococcota bacterium]|nr:HPr family phosphocarrier protein [Myxococcota bacterium]
MSEVVEWEAAFVVRSPLGLHARPAGQFVLLTEGFESEISVGRGEDWVDGRSVLSLLSLAAAAGTTLKIRAKGPDAREAAEALGELLETDHDGGS